MGKFSSKFKKEGIAVVRPVDLALCEQRTVIGELEKDNECSRESC